MLSYLVGTERKLSHAWVDTTTRLFLLTTLQNALRTSFGRVETASQETHPQIPSTDLVVTYDFVQVSPDPYREPSRFTMTEWVSLVEERGVSIERDIGLKRFDATIQEFTAQPNFRLVEGRFKFGERYLWIVARMRIPEDDSGVSQPSLATVIGGFSYYGPKIRGDRDKEDDHDRE